MSSAQALPVRGEGSTVGSRRCTAAPESGESRPGGRARSREQREERRGEGRVCLLLRRRPRPRPSFVVCNRPLLLSAMDADPTVF